MDYFPAFLKLRGKTCLLVGGGELASRKARLLLAAGATLRIVSPEINSAIDKMLQADGRLSVSRRRFRKTDVAGNWLVVSATGDPIVESAVKAAADKHRVFCNTVDDEKNCSYITPAIIDRSPIVVAVSSGGSAPVLARKIRAQIEVMLPTRLGELASLAGRWRRRVIERFDDYRTRRQFWERIFDGPVAGESLSGHDVDAEKTLSRMLESDANNGGGAGEAWLVGAGPGDPGLLTLRAVQVLQTADVILYDRLVSSDVLAYARRDAKMISVGKTPGCKANSQDEINELLVRLVAEGNKVCRLKGGDPFIFGRGGEEAAVLQAQGLRCQVVPGITSASGCAAYAGIPLTHRDMAQSLVLVTAHGKDSIDNLDWHSLARDRQTLAVYMGVRRFPEVMQQLISYGRSANTPIAIIERGTTPEQRVVRGTLGQLNLLAKAHRIEAPAMLIIGEVARLGHSETGPVEATTSGWPTSPISDSVGHAVTIA
jgi:uroporphyrin-III C-methyltransferase/precorrin-2 dehydrogenase/sirohydrochlorin ferrochelatase